MTKLAATLTTAEVTVENARLRAELSALHDELRDCRRRLVDALHAERQRIERDLHDATQGRLVSLAMSLGLLETKLPADLHAAHTIARDARRALTAVLAELREISHRIHPPILTERGLQAAIEELAERTPLPIHLDLSIQTRLLPTVESAAYFIVSEALTNTLKHSHAREARISISRTRDVVTIEVTDDGIGGAAPHRGSGLKGLVHRVEALGGRLTVSSAPGNGTTVLADLPCG